MDSGIWKWLDPNEGSKGENVQVDWSLPGQKSGVSIEGCPGWGLLLQGRGPTQAGSERKGQGSA